MDFKRDIEPLIRLEALGRMSSATPAEIETVERILTSTRDVPPSYGHYVETLVLRAEADLAEAQRGLGVSLVKEGLEILRDHRDALRAAIDPPGLTDESHDYFMGEYVALVNRTVIGPQKERIQELLLLIAAGIVVPGPGPQPRLVRGEAGWTLNSSMLDQPYQIEVDLVIKANLDWPIVDPESDPIAHSLRGWSAPGAGGALRLDRDGFVVPRQRDGATGAVAVFGPPAEGASYYNHYVPSPGVWSRALTDLDRVLGPKLSPL